MDKFLSSFIVGEIHGTGLMTEKYTQKIVARELLKIYSKLWSYSDRLLPCSLSLTCFPHFYLLHNQFLLQVVQISLPFFYYPILCGWYEGNYRRQPVHFTLEHRLSATIFYPVGVTPDIAKLMAGRLKSITRQKLTVRSKAIPPLRSQLHLGLGVKLGFRLRLYLCLFLGLGLDLDFGLILSLILSLRFRFRFRFRLRLHLCLRLRLRLCLGLGLKLGLGLRLFLCLRFCLCLILGICLGFGLSLSLSLILSLGLGLRLGLGLKLGLGIELSLGLGLCLCLCTSAFASASDSSLALASASASDSALKSDSALN